jgi:hypothetical protein
MTKDATEKWISHRNAVEKWKSNNREYYLQQKRRLAGRPEYLQKRREQYQVRKMPIKIISLHINYDTT